MEKTFGQNETMISKTDIKLQPRMKKERSNQGKYTTKVWNTLT
jgi:hypothetical protein